MVGERDGIGKSPKVFTSRGWKGFLSERHDFRLAKGSGVGETKKGSPKGDGGVQEE